MRPPKSRGAICDQTGSFRKKWKKTNPPYFSILEGVHFLPFFQTHRLVTNDILTFRGAHFKMHLMPIGLIFDKKYRHYQTPGKILS